MILMMKTSISNNCISQLKKELFHIRAICYFHKYLCWFACIIIISQKMGKAINMCFLFLLASTMTELVCPTFSEVLLSARNA